MRPPNPARKRITVCQVRAWSYSTARETLRDLPCVRRSETAEYEFLPEAERAVVAQCHVSRVLLDLYESAGIRCGPSRFSENVGITRKKQHEREGATLRAAAPDIEKHLMDLDVEYVRVRQSSAFGLVRPGATHAEVPRQCSERHSWHCRGHRRIALVCRDPESSPNCNVVLTLYTS